MEDYDVTETSPFVLTAAPPDDVVRRGHRDRSMD